ncbi:MAG: hypothetical protein ACM3ZC_13340 [Bacteroidota bacterium]
MPEHISNRENVSWIFHCAVSDLNWETHMKRLTDEELLYCVKHYRLTKTGVAKMRAEARRRGLEAQA